jgi:hypothetical protein
LTCRQFDCQMKDQQQWPPLPWKKVNSIQCSHSAVRLLNVCCARRHETAQATVSQWVNECRRAVTSLAPEQRWFRSSAQPIDCPGRRRRRGKKGCTQQKTSKKTTM